MVAGILADGQTLAVQFKNGVVHNSQGVFPVRMIRRAAVGFVKQGWLPHTAELVFQVDLESIVVEHDFGYSGGHGAGIVVAIGVR